MKLKLAPRLEQQQILAPQMILSMDILLLSAADLEARIEKEFMENPALELDEGEKESSGDGAGEALESVESAVVTEPAREKDPELEQLFDELDAFEARYGSDEAMPRINRNAEDSKHEALQNHASRATTLSEHLHEQVGFLDLDPTLSEVVGELCDSVNHRGYLEGDLEEIALSVSVPLEVAERGLAMLQTLEPRGVGARDLRECLLLQLGEGDSLEHRIVREALEDVLENRIPKVANDLGCSLYDVKESLEIIGTLNPYPGSMFAVRENAHVVPELFVDEIDGHFKVRLEEGTLPSLRISPMCSRLLREDGQNPKVLEFVRKKMESARWLIHAIDQRRRTLIDIAQAIVDRQEAYFRNGPGNLSALTMQSIADQVGVHISTVSRATNGKYIESPYGVIELRRFFTGGVERADGKIESRDNVCGMIRTIVAAENPKRPMSDSMLTRKLQEKGLDIARRTVTKYRERAGVPPARLRKKH